MKYALVLSMIMINVGEWMYINWESQITEFQKLESNSVIVLFSHLTLQMKNWGRGALRDW